MKVYQCFFIYMWPLDKQQLMISHLSIRKSFRGRRKPLWMLELKLSVILFCIIVLSVDSFSIFLWMKLLLNWLKLPFYSLFEFKFCFRNSALVGHPGASFPKGIHKKRKTGWEMWVFHSCWSLYHLLALIVAFILLGMYWERVRVL